MSKAVSRTLSVHKEHELLGRLEAAGLDDQLAQAVIESRDNALAGKVVEFVRRSGRWYKHSLIPSPQRAREIMGRNFLGVEEVSTHLGVLYPKYVLRSMEVVPFTEGLLRELSETHLLVAGSQLTWRHLKAIAPECFKHDMEVAHDHTPEGAPTLGSYWYLIRRDTTPGSDMGRNLVTGLALLEEGEDLPWVNEVVYATVLNFLVNGERLLPNMTWCKDVRPDESHDDYNICVGEFDEKGLWRYAAWRGSAYRYEGRKYRTGIMPVIRPF